MPARRTKRWAADVTETAHMGRAELAGDIAGLVVEKLRGSVISSSFPAKVGGWIRQTAEHHTLLWTHTIPMNPPGTCLLTDWRLNPDGTLQLELRDSTGLTFWRGTFRPVEASHADA